MNDMNTASNCHVSIISEDFFLMGHFGVWQHLSMWLHLFEYDYFECDYFECDYTIYWFPEKEDKLTPFA